MSKPEPNLEPPTTTTGSNLARAGWMILGIFFVGLGIIGAILPLMPTTVFLILAAGCFARSSPRLEAWLLDHPRFGPTLRSWRRDRAISRRNKLAACAGMTLGLLLFLFAVQPGWMPALAVSALMAGCAAYVVSRPSVIDPDR